MKISPQRWSRIVKALRGRRMGVVGDWMLDRYLWGTATRLSPEAAVPVVDFLEESQCLGGAGNVAANLVALGARVVPFGVVGEDEFASRLRDCLRELGMPEKGLLADASRKTTVKTRIIARHQQVVRVDRESPKPLSGPMEEQLIRRILAALRQFDALVVSDYDKGLVTDELADRVLRACHRLGVPAFVKPKRTRLTPYRGATAIVCNQKEAGFFVASRDVGLEDDDSVEEAGRALLAHFGCSAVIITRGERGMRVFEEKVPTVAGFDIPAASFEVIPRCGMGLPGLIPQSGTGRQVFDVTGAGDTVLATLALAVAAGASLREAAVLANAAAGVVVGKLGTATLSPAELLAAVRDLA